MTQIEVKALQEQLIKIGELAKQTNVTVGTLRYYESLGLIEPAFRNNKGYRYYTDDAVKQVQFIKKAQSLNFSLAEIQQILGIRRQGIPPCSLVRDLLECKIAELERQIQSTLAFKKELEAYKELWADKPQDDPNLEQFCSLIEEVNLE
ncbi:MerR family transcriptional regulator (plasmid) [Chondrocystis sp. NIES-4102]|nr:MerR family transcriptional regulator [Chondrocystis sp. NIES-4102]